MLLCDHKSLIERQQPIIQPVVFGNNLSNPQIFEASLDLSIRSDHHHFSALINSLFDCILNGQGRGNA